MREFDDKVWKVFGELSVDKKLALRREVSRLPRFISEYLVSKYYSKYPNVDEAFRKLAEIVAEYFPEPKDKELVLHRMLRQGSIKLIDEFKVRVNLRRNLYMLHIPSLQIYDALIDEGLVRRFERLLSGMWGFGVLEHRTDLYLEGREEFSPILMTDMEPFQVYNVDLKAFVEGRREFSLDAWIDLLVTTVGLNPGAYSRRQKLLLLARLIPLVEGNVNLMELGPRATGKTYLYRNVSYYTRIYSGGSVSPAQLFFNASLRIAGDIAVHDVVVFDEVSRVRFTNPDEMIGKLKDFMTGGFFERGPLKRAHSECSLVFLGNIEEEVHAKGLLQVLPDIMLDPAFLDRIHGMIPGWEMPKIMRSEEHLARGLGLAADYFAEVLHKLRKESFWSIAEAHIELGENFTIRDEKAVQKTVSGLTKLLFPHGEFDNSELRLVLDLALELRQYIVDMLSFLSPKEFPRKLLESRVRG